MRIQELEGLLAAVRLGSISKASEILHISHTALSKQIRSLESYYGVKLLQRASTGVLPTDAGKHVVERASALLSELESIYEELREFREPSRWLIGTLPSLAAAYLPDPLIAMRHAGMEVRLEIRHTSTELWEELLTGKLSGIVAESIQGLQAPYSSILFKEPLAAVVPRSHPFSSRASIAPSELADEPLLLYPPACGIRKWVEHTMRLEARTPTIVSEVGFGGFIAGMVSAGAGITVLPDSIASKLNDPALVTVPFARGDASRTIMLAASSRSVGNNMKSYFPEWRKP